MPSSRSADRGAVQVNKPIASYVLCKDAYVTYLENKHLEAADKHKLAEVMEMKEEQSG